MTDPATRQVVSRRALLKGAGGLLTATALPSVAPSHAFGAGAPDARAAVIERLTAYMAAAGARQLPPDAIEKTKHHVLDTLAAMISGADLPPGRVALAFARGRAGERTATVAASDIVCGPIEAAMANGMLAHSDETDDSHAPSHSHPGCAIVPAALAAGEQFAVDGARLLHAVALGYDVGTRVTFAMGGLRYQMESHRSTHGIASDFGACAAAGCAAGLNPRQMRWLIDYAAQQASGIVAWQRDTEHVEKALVFGGFPARNGVTAALLIHAGGTGVEDVLSGADNFLMAFAPRADPALLVDGLGERFEVTRTNIKKWTVGSPIQAPLDAIETLRRRRPFEADEVRRVIVRLATSEAKTVNDREMPDICLQHMLAVMLIDGTASFRAAHDKARMQDPAVLRARAKVTLQPDEALEQLIPRREAVVGVTLADGTTLTERVGDVRGTAENPMTREEVVAKARDLMQPVLGAAKTSRLIETTLALERVTDVRALRPLLQPASA